MASREEEYRKEELRRKLQRKNRLEQRFDGFIKEAKQFNNNGSAEFAQAAAIAALALAVYELRPKEKDQ